MPSVEWFAYNFPNRRTDKTVVEVTLEFSPSEDYDRSRLSDFVEKILQENNLLDEGEIFPALPLPDDRLACYTSLLMQTALFFQRKAGHPVSFFSVLPCAKPLQSLGLVEHQHGDVGLTAVKLGVEVLSGKRRGLSGPFAAFCKFARDRLLPKDTRAIIEAAHRCGIPAILLERLPYKRDDFIELTHGECIRRNGLIMLGHGRHRHVFDGMFCLDKTSKHNDLRADHNLRLQLLKNQGVGLAGNDTDKHGKRQFQLVVVNGQCTAVIDLSDGCWMKPELVETTLIDQVLKVNCEVGFAPMTVRIQSTDETTRLTLDNTRILDFELAPNLDRYLHQQDRQSEKLMAATADQIVDWLFHGKDQSRMPIIAITGTNGKTTTTRLVNHILSVAGYTPGMVCTEGVYLEGREILQGDQGSVGGHLAVLTNQQADIAVLETHHRGILKNGFAFSWCNVAVCLNVTEDHLGYANIETVEQMAEVKQALVQRGRDAVVLNADDIHCANMIESAGAELTCLVSMQHGADDLLAGLDANATCLALRELIDGEWWIVIHDRGHRIPLATVNSIPITFNGTALFNISNTMHAVLACYVLDVPIGTIRDAISTFNPTYDYNPGRLNVFDQLPFRVILDFAHNPDGHQKLCQFVDAQQVSGRKILAFSGSANRSDETIINMGRAVAGHFDFYFCKEYIPRKDARTKRKVAHLLQRGLLESGVSKEQTAIRGWGKQVFFEIFDSCKPGDLLVVLIGHVEKQELPGYISEYARKLT